MHLFLLFFLSLSSLDEVWDAHKSCRITNVEKQRRATLAAASLTSSFNYQPLRLYKIFEQPPGSCLHFCGSRQPQFFRIRPVEAELIGFNHEGNVLGGRMEGMRDCCGHCCVSLPPPPTRTHTHTTRRPGSWGRQAATSGILSQFQMLNVCKSSEREVAGVCAPCPSWYLKQFSNSLGSGTRWGV